MQRKKIDTIIFEVLKDGVILQGFTQLKIAKFEAKSVVFVITVKSLIGEKEEKMHIFEEELHHEEREIKPEDNSDLNLILFKDHRGKYKDLPLAKGERYRIELSAKKGYGCETKYGLNNNGIATVDNIFTFEDIDVKDKVSPKGYVYFCTDLKQGLFPNLLYRLEM